jgi:hypothetical protein
MPREDQFADQIERETAVYRYTAKVSARRYDWHGRSYCLPRLTNLVIVCAD